LPLGNWPSGFLLPQAIAISIIGNCRVLLTKAKQPFESGTSKDNHSAAYIAGIAGVALAGNPLVIDEKRHLRWDCSTLVNSFMASWPLQGPQVGPGPTGPRGPKVQLEHRASVPQGPEGQLVRQVRLVGSGSKQARKFHQVPGAGANGRKIGAQGPARLSQARSSTSPSGAVGATRPSSAPTGAVVHKRKKKKKNHRPRELD